MKIDRERVVTILAIALVAGWIAWGLWVALPVLGWGW